MSKEMKYARSVLREVVEAWDDFDTAMKADISGSILTTEQDQIIRLTKAAQRWYSAIAAAKALALEE